MRRIGPTYEMRQKLGFGKKWCHVSSCMLWGVWECQLYKSRWLLTRRIWPLHKLEKSAGVAAVGRREKQQWYIALGSTACWFLLVGSYLSRRFSSWLPSFLPFPTSCSIYHVSTMYKAWQIMKSMFLTLKILCYEGYNLYTKLWQSLQRNMCRKRSYSILWEFRDGRPWRCLAAPLSSPH